MYDNINTNSFIEVSKAVRDLIFSQFMPMERLELFVEYIVIQFFIYVVIGLILLKIFGKRINFRNITRVAIVSLWFTPSFLWVVITSLIDASFIVILAPPAIPIIIILGIKKLIMLCRRIKHQPDGIKT